MNKKILRKFCTFLKNPQGAMRNQYHLLRNVLLPSAGLLARKAMHKPFLQSLSKHDRKIVEGLNRNGYYVSHVNEFCPELAEEIFTSIEEAFQEIDMGQNVKSTNYVSHLDPNYIEKNKCNLLFGLSERILSIVENYIKLPIFYRGVIVRRDYADGQEIGTRLWHKDFEDDKIVKIIIYASDVDENSGPFQILPKHKNVEDSLLNFVDGRVSDENMFSVVNAESVRSLIGSRGTMIFADTARCFHRGKIPIKDDRDALFYAYNSSRPKSPTFAMPLYNTKELIALNELTLKQRRATQCKYA